MAEGSVWRKAGDEGRQCKAERHALSSEPLQAGYGAELYVQSAVGCGQCMRALQASGWGHCWVRRWGHCWIRAV